MCPAPAALSNTSFLSHIRYIAWRYNRRMITVTFPPGVQKHTAGARWPVTAQLLVYHMEGLFEKANPRVYHSILSFFCFYGNS
jgi:hypothetical protein